MMYGGFNIEGRESYGRPLVITGGLIRQGSGGAPATVRVTWLADPSHTNSP